MSADHLHLTHWAQDPQLSSDGRRVAWCETALDVSRDEPVSNILVAATDGTGAPRSFTDGPHDFFPRWSPDGRYLAYLSAAGGPPALYLASLEGGVPVKADTPGSVRWIEWSPTGDRLALVVGVGLEGTEGPDRDSPKAENAARVVRGWFNRLDGHGWIQGRDQLFVYDVAEGTVRQLTSGDYDHVQPAWSPDGSTIVFVSDRARARDDRPGQADLWLVAAKGGRARRLTHGIGDPAFPTFAPDGRHLAFTGVADARQQAGRDSRLFVVAADGSGQPERVVPGLDRPVSTVSVKPYVWLSAEELAFTVADAGTIGIRRARIGARTATAVVAGDSQVAGVSTASVAGRPLLAYSSAWVDSPGEIYCLQLNKRASRPVQVSRAGERLQTAVDLLPAERFETRSGDDLAIEYFVIRPKRARASSPPPMFLEIHGGPNLYNPICEALTFYQSLAGAGYAVVLPNPRGSIGYGEDFTYESRGGWGGRDFEDLMACADDAVRRGLVNPQRQFVGGYSFGGFMSAWTVGHTTRFKAATVGAPIVNHVSQFGTWDGGALYADMMASDPWDPSGELQARSPLSFAPNVETPVFLYVNDGDLRCPPSQADEFYAALKWLGKTVEYVRYPGGSHLSVFPMIGAPSQSRDRTHRILDFLGRHGGIPVEGLSS